MAKPVKSILGFLIVLILVGTFGQSYAQTVSNVKASLDPNNPNLVIVTYDLKASSANQTFKIDLLSSSDNFQKVLEKVSGDVGENQVAGNGKQIFWRAREELGLFSGNVTFEVRSTVMFSPLRLTGPKASDAFKPGESLPIKWEGGFKNATVQLELFRANILNRKITTTPNIKKYDWVVPSDLENGSNYKIKLYDMSDAGSAVMSPNFSINASVKAASKGGGGGAKKWIFIGGGALVVAGVAAAVLSGGGGEPPADVTPTDTRNPLPTPPITPDGGSTIRKIPALISFNLSH